MFELALSLVGVLTLFLIFLNLFTKYGDKTPRPHFTNHVDLSDPQIFEDILVSAVNSSVDKWGTVEILTDGREFLFDLLAEIEKAQYTIYLTNYICSDGKFSSTILDALAKKAKEWIIVRVLLDGFGSIKLSRNITRKLEEQGGKVAFFRPLTWWNLDRINRRTHIRNCSIDNKIVYLGGIALSDLWLHDKTKSNIWHDFMYKATGNIAHKGNKIFINLWTQTTGELLTPAPLPEVDSEWVTDDNSPKFISLFSIPSPDLSCNMENFVWLSIQSARKSIHIENPYLLPSDAILKALIKKSEEWIEVSIIVPWKNNDTYYTRFASHTFYSPLLAAGVKIYEYQPSRMHAKVMSIDDSWSIIGSANLDNRSSKINLEWIVGIYDKEITASIEEKFEIDKSRSLEITRSRWSKRGYFMVPIRYFARLFSQLY